MRFSKLHGLGNDYLYLDCTAQTPENLPSLAITLSDRHFGVGSDGLICILPSAAADFRMRMFNADGSEGEMCGNGIRCAAKFIYDNGLSNKTELNIETLAGVKRVKLLMSGGTVTGAAVDMGKPTLAPPLQLTAAGQTVEVWPVSMGNPHAVLFVSEPEEIDLPTLGGAIERHPAFPNRTNVEFVTVEAPDCLRLRVWERGSGETLACGTGACAALAAAVQSGRCERVARVKLPGGTLTLNWREDTGSILLTGEAAHVFDGEVDPHLLTKEAAP